MEKLEIRWILNSTTYGIYNTMWVVVLATPRYYSSEITNLMGLPVRLLLGELYAAVAHKLHTGGEEIIPTCFVLLHFILDGKVNETQT